QTTVNEIEGTLATLGTEFEVVSGQVSNKVWQTDIESAIDDLDIGTMNLITDSHFYDDKRDSGWRAIYGRLGYTGLYPHTMFYENTQSHEATRFEYTTRSLKAGEWYTFTMNFRSDRGLDIRNAVNATLEDDIDITS